MLVWSLWQDCLRTRTQIFLRTSECSSNSFHKRQRSCLINVSYKCFMSTVFPHPQPQPGADNIHYSGAACLIQCYFNKDIYCFFVYLISKLWYFTVQIHIWVLLLVFDQVRLRPWWISLFADVLLNSMDFSNNQRLIVFTVFSIALGTTVSLWSTQIYLWGRFQISFWKVILKYWL